MTLQLPRVRQVRLRRMARARGISVDQLVDEFSATGHAQYETEMRFRALAGKGSPARALALLDKVDATFGRKRCRIPNPKACPVRLDPHGKRAV